jgi:hypothetical protein
MSRQVKALFILGARRRKKFSKTRILRSPWPSAETILLRAGQCVGLILLQEGEELRRQSFQRESQKIFKGVGGPYRLDLGHALIMLAILTFMVKKIF